MALTLYSYPELFGLPDNNPFGLKVWAFLRLCGVPFRHEHLIDTSHAPRGLLPYLNDDGEVVGDSDMMIAFLTEKYGLTLDAGLTPAQRTTDLLIRRTLDDLYWCMSYSRWADPAFWPLFHDELLRTHADLTAETLAAARAYNLERYRYQGIGRYEPADVYRRGCADLAAVADLLGDNSYMFGDVPHAVDAAIYGFVANAYFYAIPTPLKACIESRRNLVLHCERMHAAVGG